VEEETLNCQLVLLVVKHAAVVLLLLLPIQESGLNRSNPCSACQLEWTDDSSQEGRKTTQIES
jgi:hypothetical protein